MQKVNKTMFEKGDLKSVEKLVKEGWNVNYYFYDGLTPLHIAAANNHPELVKFLIENNADVNAVDKKTGQTPFMYAVNNFAFDVLEMLITPNLNEKIKDNLNKTYLHYAARFTVSPIVEYFIKKGLNVNARDNFDNTPLIDAVMMLSNEEELEYEDDNLMLTSIRILLDNGADVNIQNYDGSTALHYAVDLGWMPLVKLLVERGANLNIQDEDGLAPLHCAVIQGYKEIAEYLLSKGADKNLKTCEGDTCYQIAKENEDQEMMELLKGRGM